MNGRSGGARTRDLRTPSPARYQLRYAPFHLTPQQHSISGLSYPKDNSNSFHILPDSLSKENATHGANRMIEPGRNEARVDENDQEQKGDERVNAVNRISY